MPGDHRQSGSRRQRTLLALGTKLWTDSADCPNSLTPGRYMTSISVTAHSHRAIESKLIHKIYLIVVLIQTFKDQFEMQDFILPSIEHRIKVLRPPITAVVVCAVEKFSHECTVSIERLVKIADFHFLVLFSEFFEYFLIFFAL